MIKLKYLTEEEYAACRTVRRLLKRAKKDIDALNAVRETCDMNKDKDPGGKRWTAATCRLWKLVDRLDKEGGIDASDPAEITLNGRTHCRFNNDK